MKSHNINPHSGENHPENQQCYARAMRGHQVIVPQKEGSKADRKKIVMEKKKERKPEPPRQAPLKRPLTAAALKEQMTRLAVMPPKTEKSDKFAIDKPQIQPDLNIAHEQMLDLAQGKTIKMVKSESEMRAISSRRSAERSRRSQQASQRSLEKDVTGDMTHEQMSRGNVHSDSYDHTKDLFVPVQSK